MKYHPKNRRNRNKLSFFIFIVFVIFLSLLFLAPTFIPENLVSLAKPFWSFRERLITDLIDARNLLRSKSSLVVENKKQAKEITKLRLEHLRLNFLQNENKEMKRLLGRTDVSSRVLARVLSRGTSSIFDTLVIDIGNGDVFRGDKVFVEENILIGFIDEILGKNSRVRLLSAPGNTYDVEIGPDGVPGVARGLGGGNFETTLPRGVEISIGNEIISPALNSAFLGKVGWIDRKPQSSLQKILFQSPININQTKWVLVENLPR